MYGLRAIPEYTESFIAHQFNTSFIKERCVISSFKSDVVSLFLRPFVSAALSISILHVFCLCCHFSGLMTFIQAVLLLSKEFGNTCLRIHSNVKNVLKFK